MLIEHLLSGARDGCEYRLDWVQTREQAVKLLKQRAHDVAIVDYNLVDGNALDILREAIALDWPGPIIVLTGCDDPATDKLAMKIGAFDYLTKASLDPQMLSRSIRYAIDRKQRDVLAQQTNAEMLRYISELHEAKREIEVQRQRIVSLAYHLATVENADAVLRDRSGAQHPFGSNAPGGDIIGVWRFDQDGRTLKANRVLCDLLEVDGEDSLVAQPMCDLMCPDSLQRLQAFVGDRGGRDEFTIEAQLIGQRTGRRNWVVASVARAAAESGSAMFYASVVDITDRRNTEQSMRYLARHDSLTGLCNRAAFDEHMRKAIALAQRTKMGIGVLCIDLDGFKEINDTHGHKAGDTVLREVARRIRGVTRESDTAARLGGDEFAILATHVARREDAALLGERVVETMRQPFRFRDHEIRLGASVGVALCPGDGADPSDLLEFADTALYQAKATGKGRVRFYGDTTGSVASCAREDIARALTEGQFRLDYQPVFSVDDRRLVALEALLRWDRPCGDTLRPARFLAEAEANGAIHSLGQWILRTACAQFGAWGSAVPPATALVVNVCPAQMAARPFAEQVASALSAGGMLPSQLRLDVLQRPRYARSADLRTSFTEMRAMGVGLAIDGFDGMSMTFGEFRDLIPDQIKLDVAMLRGETATPARWSFPEAILGFARPLGVTATIKGVEVAADLDAGTAIGCTEMQGHMLSAPVRAGEVSDLLTRRMH